MKTAIACMLMCLLLAPAAAPAAELGELFDEVETLVEQKQSAEALDAMREATAIIWQKSPLGFRKAVLIVGDPQAFGQYQPRGNNVFNPNEPVLIYAEPICYKFVQKDDLYVFNLSADLTLMSEDGNILGGQKGFQTWEFKSRDLVFDFFIKLTYTLTGVPAGNYIIETTLHDLNSGEQASFQTPITFK